MEKTSATDISTWLKTGHFYFVLTGASNLVDWSARSEGVERNHAVSKVNVEFPDSRVYSPNMHRNNPALAVDAGVTINDPLRHLVVCHDRIEEHLQSLERVIPDLRSDSEQKRQEVREALDKALQFLDAMGHLHTQDEEESVFPRLLANGRDEGPALTELMTMLENQHREKEAVFAKLAAQVMAFPPAPLPPSTEQATRFEGLVSQLVDLYRLHIMVENQRLIPLSEDYFKESDLGQILQEMRARRSP
ncbi:MAG: hemerythrin domain-containing protein [Candidatus Acidiferrales bacterium]